MPDADALHLLEHAYRTLMALKRAGCDWDVWADAQAEETVEEIGQYLWPPNAPSRLDEPPPLRYRHQHTHVHTGDLEETLIRLAEAGFAEADTDNKRWITPAGLLAARALLALVALALPADSPQRHHIGGTVDLLNHVIAPTPPDPTIPDHPPPLT